MSIHSFTPRLRGGTDRPWHVGIAAGAAKAWAARFAKAVRAAGGLTVGLDVPYPIEAESDFAIPVHGDARGLPAILIEVRQDMLVQAATFEAVLSALAQALHNCPPSVEEP